ncbi:MULTISPECIES: restriction endonuclease [Actinomycetes]|nr:MULTISPECIES: restriction endonuclease [Rhodococcus erythropolis group]MBY6389150.1 restriction endonuclease [Rhodococcus erythropolis]
MKSVEESLLKSTNQLLDLAAHEVAPHLDITDARLTILEAVASTFAEWDLEQYWSLMHGRSPSDTSDPKPWADKISASIKETPIPIPFALAALSREVLPKSQQRKTGAYYTDWRLAQLLASQSVPLIDTNGLWVDPACGSGTLLVAAAMTVPAGKKRAAVIRDHLAGADLSDRALRGALLSVSSLTDDLEIAALFHSRLLRQDSLQSSETWQQLAPNGTALVIGNPPWEKLRASKHELATSNGQVRHYGQSYNTEVDLTDSRTSLLSYIEAVATGTQFQGKGEHDLYKLFLELGMGLAAERGILALLVPAGLIRAQGTEDLRRELNSVSLELSISVIENRARHFAIDTRFKFLSIVARIGKGRKQPLSLKVADRAGVLPDKPVRISRSDLRTVRKDLSIPEVRTTAEWDLFARLSRNSTTVGDQSGPWAPNYRREVDMTLDQKKFRRVPGRDAVPLLEGRHVSQFRWRAKSYQSGEGRAAIWRPEPVSQMRLRTQWFVPTNDLRPDTAARVKHSRIGFCDITGQTNERSLLVARIPEGVVCGNKVPTLMLPGGGVDREDLFLALGNTFVVDWMMRRLVTTTVNFFLLNSLPFPRVAEDSATGKELIELARKITAAEGDSNADPWQIGQWRARNDALTAVAWGLKMEDMELVLADFPLVDRGQPALPEETRSTVTADLILNELAKLLSVESTRDERLQNARRSGAEPYIPAEYV